MRSSTSPPPALQRARPGDHASAIYSAILRSHERHSCALGLSTLCHLFGLLCFQEILVNITYYALLSAHYALLFAHYAYGLQVNSFVVDQITGGKNVQKLHS